MSATYGQTLDAAPPPIVEAMSRYDRLTASLLIGLAAVFVLVVVKQTLDDLFPYDFAYFHAAGRTWGAGKDPYGPAYAGFARSYIPPESALWVYPPQWWGITVPLGLLPMASAVTAWKIAGLIALTAGSALLFDVFRAVTGRAWVATALVFSIVLSSSDAAWMTLRLGQSSLFVLLGFALMLHGLRFHGPKRVALGLAILLLKPHFGLFFLLLLLGMRGGSRPALAAVALSALACLPVLFSFGIEGTIASAVRYVSALSSYDTLSWNRPGSLTGATFLMAVLGIPAPPTVAMIVIASAITAWLCRQKLALDPVDQSLVGLALFYAIVPLHNYDLILLPMFLLILPKLKPWAGAFIALALIGTWNLGSIAFALHGEQFSNWMPGVHMAALVQAGVGTLAVALVLAAIAFGRRTGCSLAT
jgi:hypothetical protein